MRTLIELIVSLLIVFGVFVLIVGIMALIILGIQFLPQYIGGFSTFMLYIAVFMLMFAGIKYFTEIINR